MNQYSLRITFFILLTGTFIDQIFQLKDFDRKEGLGEENNIIDRETHVVLSQPIINLAVTLFYLKFCPIFLSKI